MFERELKSFPEDRAVEKVIEDVEEFIPLSENLFRDVNIDTYRAEGKDVGPIKAPDRGDYRSGISQNPLYASQPESDVPQTGMHIEKKPSKGKLTVFLSFFIVLILIISVYLIFLGPFSKTHGGDSAFSIVPNFSSQLTNGTTVLFTDISDAPSNSVYQWIWDFGDGNISYERNPVHTYASMGYFNVTLVLVSNGKQYNVTKTIYVYNIDDIDDDGYPNSVDLFPEKNVSVSVSLEKFEIKDQLYQTPLENNTAYVYFVIRELSNYTVAENGTPHFNVSFIYSLPRDNFLVVRIGNLTNIEENVTFDVSDDKAEHVINIFAGFYDPIENITSYLDLDGNDETFGILLFYNITTGEFSGDDYDGIVDGSMDGRDENIDCYLEYSVKTV